MGRPQGATAWWLALWIGVMPVCLLGLVPWQLARLGSEPVAWQGRWEQWVGAWLISEGIGLAGWCVALFWRGQGTPIPLAPPSQFVVEGPYRFVRNPMALGMLLTLAGQTLVYRSWWVASYTLLAAITIHLYITRREEPELAKRYGPCYGAYRTQVPRWIPRIGVRARG